ncbi:MAG: hypothetical protein LQ339_007569 [Xanthoria mediterranea]|nr:MAG: hypothetical protein LQ339_007569 [Xanthoria mediterranea]
MLLTLHILIAHLCLPCLILSFPHEPPHHSLIPRTPLASFTAPSPFPAGAKDDASPFAATTPPINCNAARFGAHVRVRSARNALAKIPRDPTMSTFAMRQVGHSMPSWVHILPYRFMSGKCEPAFFAADRVSHHMDRLSTRKSISIESPSGGALKSTLYVEMIRVKVRPGIDFFLFIGDGLVFIQISTKSNELTSDNANWADIHAAADAIIRTCVSGSAAQGGRAIEIGWLSPLTFPFLFGLPPLDRPTSHETSESNPELMSPPPGRPTTPHGNGIVLRQQ